MKFQIAIQFLVFAKLPLWGRANGNLMAWFYSNNVVLKNVLSPSTSSGIRSSNVHNNLPIEMHKLHPTLSPKNMFSFVTLYFVTFRWYMMMKFWTWSLHRLYKDLSLYQTSVSGRLFITSTIYYILSSYQWLVWQRPRHKKRLVKMKRNWSEIRQLSKEKVHC